LFIDIFTLVEIARDTAIRYENTNLANGRRTIGNSDRYFFRLFREITVTLCSNPGINRDIFWRMNPRHKFMIA